MIVAVLKRLKFDNEYTLYRAQRKFEQDAASHKHRFHIDSGLEAIKAKCPKDD